MLRVAICDDNIGDIKVINDMATRLFKDLDINFEIYTYLNGKDLLKSKLSYDLIFLDIEMDEIDGIAIASEIRKYNYDTIIIFISNSSKYLRTGYTVRADRYFLKPLDKQEFTHEVTDVLKNKMIDNKFILDSRISSYKLYLNDIVYIEFCDRKTIVHSLHDSLTTCLTLKEWHLLLGSYSFIQNHRAYIINLKHMKRLESDTLILVNNIRLPLSRKYKLNLKNEYYAYIGKLV